MMSAPIRLILPAIASAAFVCVAAGAHAQQRDTTSPPPIMDNSFLVEEAYNQESGVVQHISTFQRAKDRSWAYTFTQEWPSPSQRHQLSYSIPVLHAPAPGGGTGLGDAKLNYRYQAAGGEGKALWVSPRLTAILPTGDVGRDRGAGGMGVEIALPVSFAVSDVLVTHWNVLGSLTRARVTSGLHGTPRSVALGASAIWLASPVFNVMLETLWDRTESLTLLGARESAKHFVVSPGVRGAFNFAKGLQIVPGIAVPIGVGPSSGERDVLLYLSFEHSFR